ncbi:hypothetical protein F383_03298 [Gossypium arboreum]|uniref:Uncharacterized protein n=1 Tax=Gossypium arboreum TaxID=29729 RepID=A0A0B0NZF4_GOSAR|nr:hypothetical protein F383_03298 [Gossypium arboreum]
MSMRGYHLPISWAINSTIVNDATYCKCCILNALAFDSYLFKLWLLLTSKYTSHTYMVHHPLRIKVCHIMNAISE